MRRAFGMQTMNRQQLQTEIDKLPLAEQFVLLDDLWQQVVKKQGSPLSSEQVEELDRRYVAYCNQQVELHPWQDVHDGIRAKHR